MEYLPNEILIDRILPQLDIVNLTKLCQSSTRFNLLCQNDYLWMYKTQYDYPEYFNNKSENQSWRDYYIYLYGAIFIPVYQDGDIIEQRLINPQQLNRSLTNIPDQVAEIFVNYLLDPVVIIQYPQQNIEILGDLNTISRIVLLPGDYSIRTRNRLDLNYYISMSHGLNNSYKINGYILTNLTSTNSQIPIYGIILNNNLMIHAPTFIQGQQPFQFPFCQGLDNAIIVAMVDALLQYLNLNVTNNQSCQLLQDLLRQIGHIIFEV